MNVYRYPENPVVTPAMVKPTREDFEVVCAFNAGVTRYKDEVILLLRVAEWAVGDEYVARVPILTCQPGREPCINIQEFQKSDPMIDFKDPRAVATPDITYLTTISHLRVARSKDGRNFTVDEKPAVFPDRLSESFGIEDPRITEIDGTYYIAYKAVSPEGIGVGLAVTQDFEHFEKKGMIFCPENLDVAIFPEKVNGRYVALHRPVPRYMGAPNMWVGYSPDIESWGDHHFLMGIQRDAWDSARIGGGAVPFKTEHGWLEIYHGATPENVYCLGAVLMDLNEPHKVIARAKDPIMVPEAPYEKYGFMPNVIFTCGALVDGDKVSIYYGACDEVMAGADMSISEILSVMT